MAIQLRRSQIKDSAINSAKLDLTDDYEFTGTLTATAVMGSDGNQIATKNYVDSVSQGLYWKDPCLVASTTNILCAANTTDGTLTFNAGGTQAIDGVILADDNRVLIKDQDTQVNNGIYVVTADGVAAGSTVILTRAEDSNTATELDGAAVFVKSGTDQSDIGFVQTSALVAIGISNVTFVQFTGAGALSAGDGIEIIGNTISVLPETGGALDFATGELALILDGNSLTQGVGGLKVATAGITNLSLATDSVSGANIQADSIGMEHLAFGYRHQSLTVANTTTNEIEIDREIENADFQGAAAFRVSRNGQTLRPNSAITVSGAGTFDGTYGASVAGSTVTILFNGMLENTDEIDIFYLD